MFDGIFLSPQVKGSMIISNKLVYTSFITSYQTKQELPKKVGSSEIRKYQENHKTS